ncbi:DUF6799 domain-containing protein [Hymenobacter sp. BT491]|uniref:DUF6799 domain-containing protein n=1 Tax=Hymenobacter sp. BT491 TaxID=2766779 RepID=UPI0016536592|nr:DUF6799 domain-containing protein [Hymenobacter sp. BT491]MBC6991352.1 hypothetical protein [Hymenobacter sp. BT491]
MCLRMLLWGCLFAGLANLTILSAVRSQSKAAVAPALRDGVFRRGSVMMRLQAGRVSRLTAPLTLANGMVVEPNGTVISKDGARQLLGAGRAVNLQGEIVNFRDDMMSATAIEQYDQQVTGAAATRIEVPSTSPVPPNAAAELLRAERRLALLQQLSELLDQRASTTIKSARFQQLDAEIKSLAAQL